MNARKLGIWLDHREARLIDVTDVAKMGVDPTVETLESRVEDKVKGMGHRPNLPPQGDSRSAGSAEPKHLQRRREHEIKAYFEQIAEEVKDTERVVILGPGEVPKELANFLKGHQKFKGEIEAVESADANLKDGQVVERVRKILDEEPMRRQVQGPNN